MKHKYNCQRISARCRGIEWQFTYDSWLAWWGDDIANRGRLKGQLVMARHKDIGPYSPANTYKATPHENSIERTEVLGKSKIAVAKRNRKVKVQTPMGIFDSIGDAAKAHGKSAQGMQHWFFTHPDKYQKLTLRNTF
jgi:hypothetical protein